MPEPDFDQIALRIVEHIIGEPEFDQPTLILEVHAIAEQLRLVWNARGAADQELRTAAETVVQRFTADEAQGYRSRDRQYAIEVLGRALKGSADA